MHGVLLHGCRPRILFRNARDCAPAQRPPASCRGHRVRCCGRESNSSCYRARTQGKCPPVPPATYCDTSSARPESWETFFFVPEEPSHLYAQNKGESLQLVVENMAETVFDLGNRGSVKLNSTASQPARESVLRYRWCKAATSPGYAPADNVFARGPLFHSERVL